MTRKLFIAVLLSIFISAGNSQNKESKAVTSQVELADPTIFFHDGTYYLYGTGGQGNTGRGFLVYTSTDMQTWSGPCGKTDGYALVKGDAFGTTGFWAPQIFHYKGKFYMAYTANEQLAIAESDSPLGPFKQETIKQLSGAEKQIDPYIFFDEDGKIYLYHVRLIDGNNLYVAEMKEDLSDIKPGSGELCIKASEYWENTQSVPWPVTEGPTILKHKGLYYFFYSANDFRNIDYAVGYATSTSPTGPWEKYSGNPIISRHNIPENGTGHGDFFYDADNNLQYVFHMHPSKERTNPRKTLIVKAAFVPGESGIDVVEVYPETLIYPVLK